MEKNSELEWHVLIVDPTYNWPELHKKTKKQKKTPKSLENKPWIDASIPQQKKHTLQAVSWTDA